MLCFSDDVACFSRICDLLNALTDLWFVTVTSGLLYGCVDVIPVVPQSFGHYRRIWWRLRCFSRRLSTSFLLRLDCLLGELYQCIPKSKRYVRLGINHGAWRYLQVKVVARRSVGEVVALSPSLGQTNTCEILGDDDDFVHPQLGVDCVGLATQKNTQQGSSCMNTL